MMSIAVRFSQIAALAGEPARAQMLHALMDGRALTAGELAAVAGVTAQTASAHLAQLVTAGLLTVARQGRHRYHRLASAEVADMIEAIMRVAEPLEPPRRLTRTGPRDADMRAARTCYDHLAGRLAVDLADALSARGHIRLDAEAALITDQGLAFFDSIGLDLGVHARAGGPTGPNSGTHGASHAGGRPLCRPCLDWSERRPHLAGKLGAALCQMVIDKQWVRRRNGARTLLITPKGQRLFRSTFGVTPRLSNHG